MDGVGVSMEAMAALAPALGTDAAALVGRAAHAQRTQEAATRLQAAWRGRRGRRAYCLVRLCRLCLCASYGRMRLTPRQEAIVKRAIALDL